MRVLNKLILDTTTVSLSQTSDVQDLDHMFAADVTATIAGANPSNKTFDTGTMEVQTLTFPAKADATDGDYVVFYDASGTAWAVALDTTGAAAATPTGAAWTAVAAGNKVYCDISLCTDAASVAAAVELAIDGLTGLPAVIATDDSANDGTMLLTQVVPGPTTNPVPKNKTDSGSGSITGVQTTGGVASEVSPSANTVSVPSHGYTTGAKCQLTTTGTVPAGLSTGTDYYLIVVDANTLKFASSQANALAGTAVGITGYGTSAAVHTIAITSTIAGSVKLQKNIEPDELTAVWFDVANSSQNFSGTTTLNWALADIGYRQLRAVVTVTSGTVTASIRANAKGG